MQYETWLGSMLLLAAGVAAAGEHDAAAPLPPGEAARTMAVPDGFRVTLFAGEPDVQQPIGFCIDDRGRLWVAEAYNYPHHGTRAGDRIVILADEDGDGRFDERTVFYDGLNYVTGIEVGFGGAWVMSPPFFYFIPDRDGDDRPDAEPRVLLDGFGNHANAHNLANGFAWGPDGWLYGTHGRTNWSLIGKPGTPDDERIRFDGGVYRYHPVRHVWEPFADGTTNPWGIDWNDYGQAFVCNCVNPHLFHVIQGAHYEPWRNRRSSQYAYERIPTISDHLHFVGKGNVRDGLGTAAEDEAGGGHAHCGTMVYLGDNWPDRYRNSVFMHNIHGRRINNDLLRREGSGYATAHAPDVLVSQDPWYMGVTLQYGPDGGVFSSDWSDTGECHSRSNTRRQTGRIYKIVYGATAEPVDLALLDDLHLAKLQRHRNDWHVRHARRLLQERAAAGRDLSDVHAHLHQMFADETDETRQLRALWALYVTGGIDDAWLIEQLARPSEHVRAWGVRLLTDDGPPPAEALDRFRDLAANETSALVRLHLASALQQLEPANRWALAAALGARGEDADDANLPLMIWYGIEPLVEVNAARFVGLAEASGLPLVRRHVARRAAEKGVRAAGLPEVVALLARSDDAGLQRDLLEGALTGLAGSRTTPMPRDWPAAYMRLSQSDDRDVRGLALRLALVFDDSNALELLRRRAADASARPAARREAIEALVSVKAEGFAPLLLPLLDDPATRTAALRGLAEYDAPRTAETILDAHASFDSNERRDAVQTLASRPAWAMALLDAVEAGRIPRGDVSAYTARQLRNLGDGELTARVKSVWGEVRATSAKRAEQIAAYRRRLKPAELAQADLARGRLLFEKNCANCHRLFGKGGTIGPDITGAQRRNLDYLLENLVDPNSLVSRDYQMEVIVTTAGRVVTGLVVAESDDALTVQTINEKLIVPKSEIEERAESRLSMMPEGLLDRLTPAEVRDLLAYVQNADGPPQNTRGTGNQAP